MSWMKRTTTLARKQLKQLGHTTLVDPYLGSVYKLATRVGLTLRSERIPIFLASAITWKETAWWRTTQRRGYLDGADAGRWRHASNWCDIQRKWDTPLVIGYGSDWVHLAGKGWCDSLHSFIDSAHDMIGCHKANAGYQPELSDQPRRRKLRVHLHIEPPWDISPLFSTQLEILGD